jgi:hypothetical protein
MKPFIDDILWGVVRSPEKGWYYVLLTLPYNSIESNLDLSDVSLPEELHYIPQKLISNLELLETVNFETINKYRIPILKFNDKWSIDLNHYEQTNINMQLQFSKLSLGTNLKRIS